jgi:hypothetical protein
MAKQKEQETSSHIKAYDITQGDLYYCTVFSISDARAAASEARARLNKRVNVTHKGNLIFSLETLKSQEDDFDADDDTWEH